jgi:hypothetical protein
MPRLGLIRIAVLIAATGAFLWLLHYVGLQTWGFGPVNFKRLLCMAAIVVVAPWLAWRLPTLRGRGLLVLGIASLALAGSYIPPLVRVVRDVVCEPRRANDASDIARNTHCAGTALLAGQNPYDTKCQLQQVVEPGPNVTIERGVTRLFGLRYPYGYPYFPAMFLGYMPFRWLATNFHSVRVANLIFLFLASVGVAWLAWKSTPQGARVLAVGMGLLAYWGNSVIPREILAYGVTDVFIAALAIWAFVALARGRIIVAGVLFGLAQAAKLLPGPLLFLPALAYLTTGRDRFKLAAAYVGTTILFVAPALAVSPETFISSTIGFYAAHHAGGDTTAYFAYLAPGSRTIFSIIGYALSLGVALMGFVVGRGQKNIAAAVAQAYAAYIVLTAFNRMAHLNYLWGVHSLGAAALALGALASRREQPAQAAAVTIETKQAVA